jgi:iron complex transport system substrate-binding protein
MRPNVELVIAMKPDLVLQSAGRREAMTPVNQLKSHGIPVAVFNPVTFEDLFNTISRIGDLTWERRAALSLIENMKKRLERAGAMTKSLKVRPKIFFEVRHPNLVAAGKKSIVNDVIKRAGGVNCIQIPKKLARLNLEAVIDCEPHVYIVQKGPMNREPSKPSNRKNFQVIKAVRNNHILFVDEQIFSRPGPRLVDAVEKLSTYLKKISEQGLDDS